MHKQRGMTAIGWLIVLGLVAFFVLLVLRLAPGYLEYYKVVSAIDSLEQEPGIASKPSFEIHKLLQRRFDVNDIHSIDQKDVEIDQQGGRTTVSVEYEVRAPMLGNIDAVATFRKSIEMVVH